MANFLLIAKGTGGDLVPFPTIGDELKKRGHRVTLLSHCSYATMAGQHAWDFVALDTPEERQRIIDDGHLLNSPSGYPAYFRRHVFPRAVAEYEAIQACYVPGETVLVTTHKACLTPLLAAEKLGIPLVRLFATVSELVTLPLMEGMYAAVLAEDLNGLRNSLGLPPLAKGDTWLRKADRELALWPIWFAPPKDWAVDALPVGFIRETGEALSPGLLEMLKGGAPPILVTAGTGLFTDPKFYEASAEACRILERRALLVTRYPQLVPGNLPEQVRHFEYLPFASLMPYLAGVIHHGGVGSLACALAAGVPQLVLASGGDRPDNGERLQRLGVGEVLPPPRWDAATIAASLERLLTAPSVRENCQAFSERLGASDAAAGTCNHIEALLPRHEGRGITASYVVPKGTTTVEKIRTLSPEKQALLAQRLKEKRQQRPRQFGSQQGPVTGPLPLSPPQTWFFKNIAIAPERFCITQGVEVSQSLDLALLRVTLEHLLAYHDGLRTKFVRTGEGILAEILPADEVSPFITAHDFSAIAPEGHNDATIRVACELQDSHNLSVPPLLRVAYLDFGPQARARILISVHHLVLDAFSQVVVLKDIQSIYIQLAAGQPVSLPPKTASMKTYTHELLAYARNSARRELDYWLNLPWEQVKPLPLDDAGRRSEDTYVRVKALAMNFGPEPTSGLMKAVKATGAPIRDFLVAALALAFKQWNEIDTLWITFGHSGRTAPLTHLDLSRTAGWIGTTTHFLLDLRQAGDPQAALKTVREQMRLTPMDGLGYEHLLYLAEDAESAEMVKAACARRGMQTLPKTHAFFNYMGDIMTAESQQNQAAFVRPVPGLNIEDITNARRGGQRFHPLEITGLMSHKSLSLTFLYGPSVFRRATIKTLAELYRQSLQSLIDPW